MGLCICAPFLVYYLLCTLFPRKAEPSWYCPTTSIRQWFQYRAKSYMAARWRHSGGPKCSTVLASQNGAVFTRTATCISCFQNYRRFGATWHVSILHWSIHYRQCSWVSVVSFFIQGQCVKDIQLLQPQYVHPCMHTCGEILHWLSFSCFTPAVVAGTGSIHNCSCEPEYTGPNTTVRCAFNWILPTTYTNWLSSTISIFCPNKVKVSWTFLRGTTSTSLVHHARHLPHKSR